MLDDFTNVANDAQVPRTTVYEYFAVLKDTLLIHEVPAWIKSRKRKPLVSSKYYFVDVGAVSALQGRLVTSRSPEFGAAFETYIVHELICYRDYVSADPITYWRSASGFEVDFILGDHTAVEVKATEHVAPQHLRSLRALDEERRLKRLLCVSLERARRQVDEVVVVPYRLFLDALWNGEFR